MTPLKAWALVPVKAFTHAKRRLAGILSDEERAELARAMLLDLFDTIGAAHLSGFTVVASDSEVARLVAMAGGDICDEPATGGLNDAVLVGLRHCRHRAPACVVVPTDVPYLEPATIAFATQSALEGFGCAAEAVRDGGTNLLAFPSRIRLAPRFGPDSFLSHLSEMRSAGLTTRILSTPDTRFDLDTPGDLRAIKTAPPDNRVGRLVSQFPATQLPEPLRGVA
ncbi:MAG: 2-phospho-L-lactate guanylyltransferase [Rhizobiales bacterium 65-79]|jgi:2-phospho-L-lactate guanylyltransferase|nr:2-phospho-L-lactate guanylyltransferase [Hyphomicrobiales bacterium]OJU05311.1 MAG: 2-phospho-L-lactate guanylyltransferase [Rhizobiales bacterium 65-79]